MVLPAIRKDGGYIAGEERVSPHLVRAYGIHHRAVVISESGVFKLIMRSDKPEARSFQNWVTRVVLPAIRKDGGYIAGEEKVAVGEMSGSSNLNSLSSGRGVVVTVQLRGCGYPRCHPTRTALYLRLRTMP